jgi:hypothetical protein
MKKLSLLLLLVFLFSACQAPVEEQPSIVSSLPSIEFTASPTNPIAPPPETIVAPSALPVPTIIQSTQLPADKWQDWPVVPTITQHAVDIYRKGLAMNLDPHAFSKVGDCQSVKAAFMGYFDIPERYSLGPNYAYLQETINNFAGHFNTDGQAVRGGFNAAAVLSPLWADPKACLPGENPLECELRITKPIIVIVSLEVWWDGRTPEKYEKLMRQILDTIIAHGAVPILATKADNVEGNNALNLTTAKLAVEYDLPLWNFWRAVQPLPNHGMDLERNDGFHISTDAWTTRSFTGLDALDSIWKGLLNAAPLVLASPTPTLTLTPGLISTTSPDLPPTATPTPGATPLGGSNRIIFGTASRNGGTYNYLGIYILDLDTHSTKKIFGEGVRLQSTSVDGKYLLVSDGAALYRTNVDGAYPRLLTDSLYAFGPTDAVWLPDGNIAALISGNGSPVIAILSSNGVIQREFLSQTPFPITLFATSDAEHIYWESGSCSSPGICKTTGLWFTQQDGNSVELPNLMDPAMSPDGTKLVSVPTSLADQNQLIFSMSDGSDPHYIPLPGNDLLSYSWSHDGTTLAAVVANVSDYSGKALGNRNFVVDPRTRSIREFLQNTLLNPFVLWSPDDSSLFWIGTLSDGANYTIGGSLVILGNQQIINFDEAIGQRSQEYITLTNASWLPLP